MAVFRPWAGFSPNCKAVLVQTAHCAVTVSEKTIVISKINDMLNRYFIAACKVKAVMGMFNYKLKN